MRLLSILFLSLSLAISCLATSAFASEPSTVNINTADAETLSQVLKGVGPSKAEAIVRYRESFGQFEAMEELEAVKGIGPSIVERNRDKILLN